MTTTDRIAPTFGDLGLPAPLVASLHERGLATPFPIQSATIPDALAGRDVCGRAPTGSGKTLAFGIPLVLAADRARPRRPTGLVLVPTRELAAQVAGELQALAKPKGPWVASFYGGVGFDRQLRALRRGVEIAVACPGRLADLLQQGEIDLGDVRFVVVDEADRMSDMGFLPEVRRLLDRCHPDRQTLLFSATLDGDVDVLISGYQRDPVRHELHDDGDGSSNADHHFWAVERTERVRTTAEAIRRAGPTVVFCRTKRGADRVARQLANAGIRVAAIHGNRSQAQRDRALRAFHDRQIDALVATDVAARGIHVDDVACVVHFDPPADDKAYVHRSGRTARAGSSGVVVSLVPDDLRAEVRRLQRALGRPVGLTSADLDLIGPARGRERRHRDGTARTDRAARTDRSDADRAAGATSGSTRRDRRPPSRTRRGRPASSARGGSGRTGGGNGRGRRQRRGARM